MVVIINNELGTSMKRQAAYTRTILSPLICIAMLSGCVSLRGTPENALDSVAAEIKEGGKIYSTRSEILEHYDNTTDVTKRKESRNRVLLLYMEAIDDNYDQYAARLFNEGIQFGLGFETAIIGLAATASLFESSADDLAKAISAAAGIHAAVNKNLYFDRTLPALIATMDARRTKIETQLISKMKQPTSDYPIEGVLRDLRKYQQAGTLYRAITDLTGLAVAENNDAQAGYEAELGYSCVSDGELDAEFAKITDHIRTIARPAVNGDLEAQQKLRTIAIIFGAKSTGTINEVLKEM